MCDFRQNSLLSLTKSLSSRLHACTQDSKATIQQCMCTKRSSLRLLCYCAGWEAEPWYWAVWEQLAARNNSFLCCVEKPPTVVVVCIWCSLTGACCSKLSSDKLRWETWTMQDYGNTHTHRHSHTFSANRLSGALGFGGWGRGVGSHHVAYLCFAGSQPSSGPALD